MKVLLDSSVLIEYEKQSQSDLLEALLDSKHQLYVSTVIVSEYLYHLIGIISGRSPMSVCESRKIGETLSQHDTKAFLSVFQFLDTSSQALLLGIDFMKAYNLLSNDAFILASCKLEGIGVLASYDTDFTAACKAEGIKLISSIMDIA